MAKETRKQRQEREQAEQNLIVEEFKKTYHKRLCDLLFNYLTLPHPRFSVTLCENGVLTFEHKKSSSCGSVMSVCSNFDMNYSNSFIYTFEQFELYVLDYKEELEFEKAQMKKKQDALAKLTKEERELLGLS